jgi:hypothetical protein
MIDYGRMIKRPLSDLDRYRLGKDEATAEKNSPMLQIARDYGSASVSALKRWDNPFPLPKGKKKRHIGNYRDGAK